MQRPQEERQRHSTPRDTDGEGETSRAKEPDPHKPPREDCNEGIPGRNNRGNRPILYHPEIGERPAAFLGHPTRAQPREGNSERMSFSLHGCVGTVNRVPVHGRGTTLPCPSEVQNALY